MIFIWFIFAFVNRSSNWKLISFQDIVVMTNNVQRCEYYRRESANVKSRWACVVPMEVLKANLNRFQIPNNKADCDVSTKYPITRPTVTWVHSGAPHFNHCYSLYCKHGSFRVGVIPAFFTILPSSRKFPPRENKTCKTLLRKDEEYREITPTWKVLTTFREIFSQQK